MTNNAARIERRNDGTVILPRIGAYVVVYWHDGAVLGDRVDDHFDDETGFVTVSGVQVFAEDAEWTAEA